MTSAPKLSHTSLRSFTVSGRPPLFFESQRIIRSGSILLWISPVIVGPKVFSWSEPIQIRNQLGLWMQVDNAAPMPVPVQMRIPRLNMAEAWPTPAVTISAPAGLQVEQSEKHTKLELPSPHRLGRIVNHLLCKVSLHSADHVVSVRTDPLANDAKSMILHNRGTADSPQQTLLHAPSELQDRNLGRWLHTRISTQSHWQSTLHSPKASTHNLNLNGHFSEREPRDKHTIGPTS